MVDMHLAAILHDIRSVHNVGSIFRTADGAGFEKLYLCGITPSPTDRFGKIRPDFGKVSLGAEKSVAWESVPDVRNLIKKLKKDGWIVLALEQSERSISLTAKNLRPNLLRMVRPRPVALVVGNEVDGINQQIVNESDTVIEIPQFGTKHSLNIAVSVGIVVWDFISKSAAFPLTN